MCIRDRLRDDLESAYPTEALDDHTQTWRLQISPLHQTKFYDALLNTESLSDLLSRLGGGLAVQVHDLVEQEWKDWLLPPKPPSPAPDVSLEQAKKDRQALVDAAKRLEYAEQIAGQGSFLVTKPLRALAQRFAVQPPLAIVLGPKGAGKTFLFMHVVARQKWTTFVEQTLGQASTAKPACWVWPLAWSRQVQLGEPALALVRSCAAQCLHKLYPDPVARPADWTLSRLQRCV